MIEAHQLSVGYGDNPSKVLVRDLSFKLAPGEVLCVLGPNGVGKTTLLKTLLGLEKPISGDVLVQQHSVYSMHRAEIAKHIAWVPQRQTPAFAQTVRESVLMGRIRHFGTLTGPRPIDFKITDDTLRALGLYQLQCTPVDQLSGGQHQLTLIARAWCQQAPIVLMDEPTANLDFANTKLIHDRISELCKHADHGFIVTTHEPQWALALDAKVLMIQSTGEVISGRAKDVLNTETLSRTYGTPLSLETTPSGQQVIVG